MKSRLYHQAYCTNINVLRNTNFYVRCFNSYLYKNVATAPKMGGKWLI